MSCVEVPAPSSPLAPGPVLSTFPGQNGLHRQGGNAPPSRLNPLAGDFDPGNDRHGGRQQGGNQGRGRGGGGGRGGLSSAMNRSGQNQQQQPLNRQSTGEVGASQADGATTSGSNAATTITPANGGGTGTGGGSGSGAAPRGAAGGGGGGGGGGASASTPTTASASGTPTLTGGAAGGTPAATGGAAGGSRIGGVANANHLLNFQYESSRGTSGRGQGRGGYRPGSARGGGGGGGGGGAYSASGSSARRYPASKPQKYDKNKFLQANFRFLVSDAVDVSAYEADADKMFDWEDVLQVEMATAAPVQCPISLDSPPLCPQITPCGHIFSFPAIMHHLINHGGEQLRRSAPCPLCFAPVVARELRLVRVRSVVQPRAGDQLTLALIRRTRTSIIPQPVEPEAAAAATAAAVGGSGGGPRRSGGGCGGEPASLFDRNPFAKFLVGGDASALWRAAAEQLAECAMQLVAEGGSDAALEAPYVYGALDQLAARARRWAEHRAACLAARGLLATREGQAAAPEALGAAAEALVKKMFTAAVHDVSKARETAVHQAALEEEFPSLAPAGSPMSGGPASQRSAAGDTGPTAARYASAAAAAPSPVLPGTTASGAGCSNSKAAEQPGSIAAAVAAASGGGGSGGEGRPASSPTDAAVADTATAAAATEPPPEQRLPFDAVFSDDEQDEREGGVAAAAAAAGSELPTQPPRRQSSSTSDVVTAPVGAAAAAGGVGPSPSPPSAVLLGSEGLLGTSPTTTGMNTPGTQGEFYTYQAADGSWVFLHPLNLRCLLHQHGSYDSCPPVITGRLLELEDVVQSDATRRRWRFLSHLPLSGAFKLCELAMGDLVPPEALAPFGEELAAREKRRRRQRADDRRQAVAEAAAAARAAAARLGPSAEELQAMPSLSQTVTGSGGATAGAGGSGLVAAAGAAVAALAREMALSPSEVAESIALQASLEDAAAAAATTVGAGGGAGGGVSFAHITKMGYAATGPALGSSPPMLGGSIAAAAGVPAPVPSGAWGTRASAVGVAAAAPSASPWGIAGGSGAAAAAGAGILVGLSSPWGAGKGAPAGIKAAAAGAAGLAATKAAAEGDNAAAGSGRKGKSGKGTLLFSTGNQRKY